MLYVWLAVLGLGDMEVMVLGNPFKKEEEEWLVDGGGECELGQGDNSPGGGGKRDVKKLKGRDQE